MTKPLESIDPHSLPFAWMSELRNLPERPGVYFVIEGLFVGYIGQSANIKKRWREHPVKKSIPRDKRQRVRVAWMECAPKELDRVETGLIRRYQPPLNGNQSGYGRKKREASRRAYEKAMRKGGLVLVREILWNGHIYADTGVRVLAKNIASAIEARERWAKEDWAGAETRYRIRPLSGRPKKAAKKAKKGSK